ncbi:MAG TPA: DUF58 domain-containing protein [Solirubrobacterales bacterium]|nr:DUF58 domain-containing protein [Solirubrobacterales bacterium]
MPAARTTLVLAAAFVLAGGAFDSPSLYVPGIALAFLVLTCRAWVRLAARRVELRTERGPWSIPEGEPYPIQVSIRAPVPLPAASVVHPLAGHEVRLGTGARRRVLVEVPSLRRGRHRLAPVRLVLSDPLALDAVEVRGGEGDEVLVLPRVEPVLVRGRRAGASAAGVLDGIEGIGAGGLDTRPIDFEVDGLRPYRHGSPASRIHWPTAARMGELVEHRLVAGADSSPLVVLDSSDPAGEEALDQAVRAAASLCVHLAPAGGCALQLGRERRPHQVDAQLRAWPQVHARLAIVEAGEPAPVMHRRGGAQIVFWVTASASQPSGAAASASAFYLVTPVPSGEASPAFTVAGCAGRRLRSSSRAPARAA